MAIEVRGLTKAFGQFVALKDVSLSNVVFLQYPTGTDPANPNRVVADSQGVAVLQSALANDQPVQLSGKLGAATEAAPGTTPTPTSTSTVAPPSSTASRSSPAPR